MGQGHYNAIGYGCLAPELPRKKWDEDYAHGGLMADDYFDAISDAGARHSYESKTDYTAIILADSGFDNMTMSPTTTLDGFVNFAQSLVTRKVVAKWERVRKVAKRHGVVLPAGQLLFIADYD
jgi:hypothetical protein